METKKNEKNEKHVNHFYCKECNYKCSYNCDWTRHISTRKHFLSKAGNNLEIEETQKNECDCECGKKYLTKSGLWKHKLICTFSHQNKPENFKITTQMFYDLLHQNNELQKSLIEMSKKGTIINNCNNNSNNKTFNLQVYLNETCKDAINLSDFVDKIHVTIDDLEKVGETSYAEGISKVFIKNLNDINVDERPIHCTDSKRETLYIKDNNQWTKDDDDKTALTKAIKQVTNKNIDQIFVWQKLHPEYIDPESKQNDQYLKIVMNSMPGSTTEETNKNYEKIVKNIIKKTVIEK